MSTDKTERLDNINGHKNKLANLYFKKITNREIILPVKASKGFDVYHIFAIRHLRRDSLRKYLEGEGIKTEIHYPIAPHRQKAYSSYFSGRHYPLSEEIHATELSLPISLCHSEDEINQVIEALNSFE